MQSNVGADVIVTDSMPVACNDRCASHRNAALDFDRGIWEFPIVALSTRPVRITQLKKHPHVLIEQPDDSEGRVIVFFVKQLAIFAV